MAGPSDSPCPLCGEALPPDARRCDNCGAVLAGRDADDMRALAEALSIDEGAQRLRDSDLHPPEEPEEGAEEPTGAEGSVLYLCPSCGAFVHGTDVTCGNCGVRLDDETAEAEEPESRPCPHCDATIHIAAEECPDCGKPVAPSSTPSPGGVCAECGAVVLVGQDACGVCGASFKPPEIVAPKVESREAIVEDELERPLKELLAKGPPAESREVLRRTAWRPPPKAPRAPGAAVRVATPPSRMAPLREVATIASGLAVLAIAAAFSVGVAGREWGQLFLFGVLFGLGAAVTAPDLRGVSRSPLLLAGALGTALLATVPIAALLGASLDAVTAGGLLAVGTGLLLVQAWRLRNGAGVYVPWLAGLLVLALLPLPPLAAIPFGSPEVAAGAWAVGSALALGTASLVLFRRGFRYAAEARLAHGDEAFTKRDYKTALGAYDAAIAFARRAGREVDAGWYGKGSVLVATGQAQDAVRCFDRALALNPANEVAWVNKGTALTRLGRMNDALRCYNSAIKVNPRYEVAWNNKGNALARVGKHEWALQCYDRALELDPSYRTAWVNKGFVLTKLGRFEEAGECADTALRLTTGVAARS